MNDIIAARSQMALSMIFHIVFSCIGMTMPFLWQWPIFFFFVQETRFIKM
jgi:cytochrome d ubiquinol oxidase subunit I